VTAIAFGLNAGSGAVDRVLSTSFPQEGSQSGLEMVDNGMLTLVRGNQVSNNQPTTFRIQGAPRRLQRASRTAKPFLQWQGSSSRLSNFPRWGL